MCTLKNDRNPFINEVSIEFDEHFMSVDFKGEASSVGSLITVYNVAIYNAVIKYLES